MKIRYTYLVCILLCLLEISAPKNALAQDVVDPLKGQEKVFLQLDKGYYLSGTALKYSAYVVNAKDQKLSISSSVLDVKILNSNNREVISQKLLLNNGRAEGEVELNKSMPSGNYLIIAYTTHSTDFNYKHAFKQKITILNPREEVLLSTQNEIEFEFYPEGGHIIGGHINTVAFKANYLGADWSGIVVSNEGDTVSYINPYKLNYGQMSFFAKDHVTYTAKINNAEGVANFELPKVTNSKLGGRIVNIESDTLAVIVNIGDNYSGDQIGMVVYNNSEVILGAKQIIKNRRLIFNLPTALLRSGLNSILFYDENQNIISERNYYKRDDKQSAEILKIDIDKIDKKSRVVMPINSDGTNSKSVAINASISIRNLDHFDSLKQNDMNLYYNMFSSLNILSPSKEIQAISQDSFFTDIYLKTKSTALRNISQLVKESERRIIASNKEYFIIAGRVTDKNSGKPIQDSVIYCSVLGEVPQFYANKTDDDGRFLFQLRSFFGASDIVLKVANIDESKDNLKYSLESNDINIKTFGFQDDFSYDLKIVEAYLRYHRENELVDRVYDPSKSSSSEGQEKRSVTGFFPTYSDSKDLTEYEYLKDFKQISRELLPGLAIKKAGNSEKIFLREIDNSGRNSFIDRFEKEPLILMDGLPVFDNSSILNFNTSQVKMVSLINKKYFINGVFHDGILELSTRSSDYYQKNSSNHFWFSMQGYYQNDKDRPKWEGELNVNDQLPDFRDVLYWNGNLKIAPDREGGIRFDSSDDVGMFFIEMHGIDQFGKIYQATGTIEVD